MLVLISEPCAVSYVHLDPFVQVCALMDFQSQQACTAAAVMNSGGAPWCVAGYEGGCLRLFDLATASLVWSSEGAGRAGSIMAIEPSPDAKQLLAIARYAATYQLQSD